MGEWEADECLCMYLHTIYCLLSDYICGRIYYLASVKLYFVVFVLFKRFVCLVGWLVFFWVFLFLLLSRSLYSAVSLTRVREWRF